MIRAERITSTIGLSYILTFLLFVKIVDATGTSLKQFREVMSRNEGMCQLAIPTADQVDQEENLGFQINLPSDTYAPGIPLKVTVAGTTPYTGVIIQAVVKHTTTTIGSFTQTSGSRPVTEVDSMTSYTCASVTSSLCANTVTYTCNETGDTLLSVYNTPVTNVSLIWAPSNNEQRTIQFIARVFINEVKSIVIKSTYIDKGFREITLNECGLKKGCFRYGVRGCTARTCDYLVTYHVTGADAEFELSAKADWVAIGFSSDNKMGGDDVLLCSRDRYSNDGEVSVRRYAIELTHQSPVYKHNNPLFDIEAEQSSDRVTCRFKRPLKISRGGDQFSLDLSTNWYQLYAWGLMSTSGSLNRHTMEKPPTSEDKVTLRQSRNVIIVSSAYSTTFNSFHWSISLTVPLLIINIYPYIHKYCEITL